MNKDTEKFLYENWFKLVLTVIALLALGIYAYQTLVVLPREKEDIENKTYHEKIDRENKATLEKTDKEQKKLKSERDYLRCKLAARADYDANWNSNCKKRSLKTDCTLPLQLAENVNNSLKTAEEVCFKEYKIEIAE